MQVLVIRLKYGLAQINKIKKHKLCLEHNYKTLITEQN